MTDGVWWRASAACSSAPLDMVDGAFDAPGSPAAKQFRAQFCSFCPVWKACLDEAMATGEAGIWGGTSGNLRTRHGSPSYRHAQPDPNRMRREA